MLERPFLFLTRRRVGDAGGGLLLGASLGLVFVPCTGPILGTLIPLVGAHRSNFDVVLLVLVFSIGLAAPLLAIATGSRRAAASLRANGQTIRIAAGVVVALMAVVLYNGWAARVQTAVPGYVKWAQDLVVGKRVTIQTTVVSGKPVVKTVTYRTTTKTTHTKAVSPQ